MKKILLFTIFNVALIGMSYAQLPYTETFDNGIPGNWTNIDNTPNGGGVWEAISESGENFVAFDSDGYGDDGIPENADLVTPGINCSAASFVVVSFQSGFRQFANSVGTASFSTDNGITWTDFYTVNSTGSEVVLEDLTDDLAGESNVRFKFNYVGDWDYFWFIDDFSVYTPPTKDMAVLEVTIDPFYDIADAPVSITGSVTNLGSETITTFDINYTVDGGAAVTSNINGVNIPFGATYNFAHPTGFDPGSAGTYVVTAFATNLNGGNDAVPANDEASASTLFYDVAVQRVPLFEVFTGSTCPPCLPGNENFHNIVDSKPAHHFVSIKFQQDFPGTGDPYATNESVARRNFYNVNSIPRMELDGGWDGNAQSFSQALYNESRANPAFTFLHATYDVDVATKTVTIEVEGLPVTDYPASTYKLHVAVIENLTTMNVKNNGETEFYEVTKKMLPDNNGTPIASLDNLTPYTFSTTFAFVGNYRLPSNGQGANRINHSTEHSVEEFSDLRVVVWIEDESSKTVLQAFNAVNPQDTDGDGVPDEVETYLGTGVNDASDFPDLDNDGLSDWKEVSDGTNPLESNGSVGIKDLEFEMAVSLSPVPASEVLNVKFALESAEDIDLSIVSVDGKVVATRTLANTDNVNTTFDVSSLVNGAYFLQIETNEGVNSSKFIVNHK